MKTLDDVMDCPYCKSGDTYSYSTDEIEFVGNGTGRYYTDCHCSNCGEDFRLYTEFKYQITDSWTR